MRIENRDFASLDPTQERIRQELSFSHFQYLYKGGDKITAPESQLLFDEAIVALACLSEDLSHVALAKRNVGALSEDITKPPYKVLMNTGTNSFAVLNSVMIIRSVEKKLQQKKTSLAGRERLVAVHANRFIEHCVLQSIKTNVRFLSGVIICDTIQEQINTIVDELIPKITTIINTLYAESYPANIFKNVTKCKSIKEQMG